jgi:hypothetical protein
MPYTILRSGNILTVLVIEPKVDDLPRGLAEILRRVDAGGISEVHVGFDEAAWDTQWARCALTAFEKNAANIGVVVRVLGADARQELAGRGN